MTDLTSARLGVCFSGGGFRAALYGLGVARYLAEAGLLRRTEVICGVSGGAVVSGALSAAQVRHGPQALEAEDFQHLAFDPFMAAVTESNIRNKALGRWLARRLTPWGHNRGQALSDVLETTLLQDVKHLGDLPQRPQLIITTTELNAGRAFRLSRDFIGSWDYGYVPPPAQLKLATAVAASAAVPIVFPPVHLATEGLGMKEGTPPELVLVDGGVYDNLGVEWFQGWASGRPSQAVPADFLVIVNASGPLGKAKGLGGWRAWKRAKSVQYAQTQATRVRWLVEHLVSGDQQGTYLGITRDPRNFQFPDRSPIDPACYVGALPSSVTQPLASLRTDLNRFSREEAELLAYHGYWSCHARFASLYSGAAVSQPSWTEYADLSEQEAARLREAVTGARHRFGLGPRLR